MKAKASTSSIRHVVSLTNIQVLIPAYCLLRNKLCWKGQLGGGFCETECCTSMTIQLESASNLSVVQDPA